MIGYVYVLWEKDENNIFYVGATIDPRTRLVAHINSHGEYYLDEDGYYAWRTIKRPMGMFIIEEVEFETRRTLLKCEDFWIHQFKAWGFPLENVIYSGYSFSNHRRKLLQTMGYDLINGKVVCMDNS